MKILQTLSYLYIFSFFAPSLELTIAVLNESKSDNGNTDQITGSSSHRQVHLETRCYMQTYPNGKIYNCSSTPPSKSTPAPDQEARIARRNCGQHSHLVGDNCICNPNFKKFPFSELCVKEEGQYCEFQRNECHTDMTYMACINNVCACEESDKYDPATMRCLGKVGGLCYPGIKDCISNAECVNYPSSMDIQKSSMDAETNDLEYVMSSGSDIELSGRCECKEDYIESARGLCKKGYDQTCSSSEECDNHLICKEGVCACKTSLQVYDGSSNSCVSLVGAMCSERKSDEVLCVRNAYCKKTNMMLQEGRCSCMEDATETRMRTCVRVTSSSSTLESLAFPVLSDRDGGNVGRFESTGRVLFSDY